jgi:hypothetical protein
MAPTKPRQLTDPSTRYLPRHLWYADDATSLIRELQATAWPLGWHLAMGGGVLTHGYSDKDLDFYALPIYGKGDKPSTEALVSALGEQGLLLLEVLASSLKLKCQHECYAFSGHMVWRNCKRIDLFVVKP